MSNKNIAIIFAGGSGQRMGAGIPKQFLEINGKPVIIHTLEIFQYHPQIDMIYISVIEEYIIYMEDLVKTYGLSKVVKIIPGGDTAQDSIYKALTTARSDNDAKDIVLLHDGVRPYVSYDVVSKNIECVRENGNAITSTPCFETILFSENGQVVEDVPLRKNLYCAQAPQSFFLGEIIEIHDTIKNRPEGYTDMVDACTILKFLNIPTHFIEGNRGNIKVTTPEDVYIFRALLSYKENEQTFGLGITNNMNSKVRGIINKDNQ